MAKYISTSDLDLLDLDLLHFQNHAQKEMEYPVHVVLLARAGEKEIVADWMEENGLDAIAHQLRDYEGKGHFSCSQEPHHGVFDPREPSSHIRLHGDVIMDWSKKQPPPNWFYEPTLPALPKFPDFKIPPLNFKIPSLPFIIHEANTPMANTLPIHVVLLARAGEREVLADWMEENNEEAFAAQLRKYERDNWSRLVDHESQEKLHEVAAANLLSIIGAQVLAYDSFIKQHKIKQCYSEKCGRCGADSPCCEHDEVDIGVGVQTGNHHFCCPVHGPWIYGQRRMDELMGERATWPRVIYKFLDEGET